MIIESSLVADYFASLFLQDWGEKPSDVIDEEEFELSLEYQSNGNIFLFDAKGTGIDGCRFLWDIDGDGSYDREGRRIIAEMPYGPREVTLCVQKGDEQMIQTISVSSQYYSGGFEIPMKYYPIIILCAAVICCGIIRGSKGK